jgi:signal transduction histidine kinase
MTLPTVKDEGEQAGEAAVVGSASRRRFLTTSLAGGGTLLAGGALFGAMPRLAATAPSPAQDRRILNFLLRLEYAQVAFYEQALERGAVRGELRELAEEARDHERAHVRFLRGRLGRAAKPAPEFDFAEAVGGRRPFLRMALALEENTLAAYIGQSANLSRDLRTPAARIVSTEARHCAWIKDIRGALPAPRAYDPGKSAQAVSRELARRGISAFA